MPKITIYTTPACVYCQMAKKYFNEHGIAYQEKDVLADPQARKEMIEKSGQLGVPFIEINGEVVIGFNQSRLEEIIKQEKLKS